MVCSGPECVVKLQFQPLWCFRLHTVPCFTSSDDIRARMMERLVRVGAVVAAVPLVDHELLEGVEIRWDEGADGLVVVVEDLLPSTL